MHLRSYYPQQGTLLWFVKDSSTNGTWINAERIQKGMSLVMQPGDHLKLSCGDSFLEYVFEEEDANELERASKRKVLFHVLKQAFT